MPVVEGQKEPRFYLVHEPAAFREVAASVDSEKKEDDEEASSSPVKRFPLLFYCHGKDETAWYSALKQTHWRQLSNTYRLLIIFGQSQGRIWL